MTDWELPPGEQTKLDKFLPARVAEIVKCKTKGCNIHFSSLEQREYCWFCLIGKNQDG